MTNTFNRLLKICKDGNLSEVDSSCELTNVNIRAENDILIKTICTSKNFHILSWLLDLGKQLGTPYDLDSLLIVLISNMDEQSIDVFIDCITAYTKKCEQEEIKTKEETNDCVTQKITELNLSGNEDLPELVGDDYLETDKVKLINIPEFKFIKFNDVSELNVNLTPNEDLLELIDDKSSLTDRDRLQFKIIPELNVKISTDEIIPELPKVQSDLKNIDMPELVLYYATWCRFSREFLEVWSEFDKYAKDNLPNVRVMSINCEGANEILCLQKSIFGFPTIMLYLVDGSEHKFNGPRTIDELKQFVAQYVQEEINKKLPTLQVEHQQTEITLQNCKDHIDEYSARKDSLPNVEIITKWTDNLNEYKNFQTEFKKLIKDSSNNEEKSNNDESKQLTMETVYLTKNINNSNKYITELKTLVEDSSNNDELKQVNISETMEPDINLTKDNNNYVTSEIEQKYYKTYFEPENTEIKLVQQIPKNEQIKPKSMISISEETNEYDTYNLSNARETHKQVIRLLVEEIDVMIKSTSNSLKGSSCEFNLTKEQIKYYEELKNILTHHHYVVWLVSDINNATAIHIEW